jgi:hypothetical protein
MIEPTEADIGRRVVYIGNNHSGRHPEWLEYGVITHTTNGLVFVRYDGEGHSKLTYGRDLEWQSPSNPSPDSIPAS